MLKESDNTEMPTDSIMTKWEKAMSKKTVSCLLLLFCFMISKMVDELSKTPVSIQSLKPDPDKPNPRLGIGMMTFSPDGKYLVTRNGTPPSSSPPLTSRYDAALSLDIRHGNTPTDTINHADISPYRQTSLLESCF